MANTKKEFAKKLSFAYEELFNALFTAFELYTNTFKQKSLAIDRAFGKENFMDFLESKRRKLQNMHDEESVKEQEMLSDIILRKRKESVLYENENIDVLTKKKKIIGEQIIVYCNSAFEKFRVTLVELLFKNNEESMKQYINTFKDVAADRLDKTGDKRYVKVHDADSIKEKNLKLLQEYNKINSIEKRMHGIALDNPLVEGIYNKNLFVYTMFREIRNLVVHRSKGREEERVRLDEVFVDSIKSAAGRVSGQGRAINELFKEYLSLDYSEVLEIISSKKLETLTSEEKKLISLFRSRPKDKSLQKKVDVIYENIFETLGKVSFTIKPTFILDSIMSIINLAHLYCFSICEKNDLELNESLFNDMCIDYYENDNKNVYIGFFVREKISSLYYQKIKKNKNKTSQADALRLVNFILANDLVSRHYVVEKVADRIKKETDSLLSLLKNSSKSGEVMHDIVSSYLKRDLRALTKATDKWLQISGSKKTILFDWYIYRSLNKEPFIDLYLSTEIKK